MSFNYRILKHDNGTLSIVEVYYDHDKKIELVSEPMAPMGDNSKDLKEDIMAMLEAFKKPFLTEDNL